MNESRLFREVAFISGYSGLDESSIIAQAIREGIRILYRNAIIDSYLSGKISREDAVKEIGAESVQEIEYQKESLRKDILWGLGNE